MALSSQDGHVAAKAETCSDADDVFVDRKRHRVYVSCGEGVVDVLEANEAGYRRLARVPTGSGARTSLFVPELDVCHIEGSIASLDDNDRSCARGDHRLGGYRQFGLTRGTGEIQRHVHPGRKPIAGIFDRDTCAQRASLPVHIG